MALFLPEPCEYHHRPLLMALECRSRWGSRQTELACMAGAWG